MKAFTRKHAALTAFLTVLLFPGVPAWSLSGLTLQSTGTSLDLRPSWSFTDCGSSSDALQIHKLAISPDPPVPGRDLKVSGSGYLSETILEGAYINVVVKLGNTRILTQKFDICEEARTNNLTVQCPVQPGQYDLTHTIHIPRETPRARYTVLSRAFTVDDHDIACADIKVNLLPF
ncbi:hypothetical protein BOTBODRAFT_152449 [Botryobasidium botryosum FD-172 SS1]|uniref:Phosphatidylglycerol/phosphatidylinositol transfer protein n=1 Tax=Botryobasidium botryosum (strain FD-172 SS1) TaxID=930990 RepID=A0A067MWC1_BOTB1|nr:hypothetical protein BOTBODRAFT_152449 [Botryobasidium botryosum FD-172 SS1]